MAKIFLHIAGQLLSKTLGSPAKMCFQYLTNIHSGRNTKRVQDYIDRRPIRQIRHILFRQYPGDNPFVPMSTGHLIPDRYLSLHGYVYLNHLYNTWRQFISSLKPVYPLIKYNLYKVYLLIKIINGMFYFLFYMFICQGHLIPPGHRNLVYYIFCNNHALFYKNIALFIKKFLR